MAFSPKQITQYQAEHLAELQGDVSDTAISYCLSLIPPFQSGDVIHDNACGSGAVTEAIMTTKPSEATVQIHATDINAQFVAGVESLAKAKNWPVTAAVMAAQELSFEDNTFTQSITSFAFHCLGDHLDFHEDDLRTALQGGGFEAGNISCTNTTAYLKVPPNGLKRWAQLAWSYLGHLPSGWSQGDEDHWDEAIDDIVEQLRSGEGIEAGDNGETIMR
ncbi:S-adenosyl-L-methionine-dependent methyltransferase [Astrocystis sublimbata]|nr:S-adenosyl-L-methionine-dependent methyltransferase [Astrocystis sublimbata]